MNKTITMIRIVAGLGENENIIKASNELNEIDDLEITLVKTEDELIEAFKNPEIDAVIRGSLKASKVIEPLILIQKTMKVFQRIMNSCLLQ